MPINKGLGAEGVTAKEVYCLHARGASVVVPLWGHVDSGKTTLFNLLQQLSAIANGLPTMEGNTGLVRQVLSKPSNTTTNPGRSVFLYWYGGAMPGFCCGLHQPTATDAVGGGESFP